jgi:predicted aspartyl protease
MQLTLKDDLPFTQVTLIYDGKRVDIADVLVDTGSGGTVFAAQAVAPAGIEPEPNDVLYAIRGVGGIETVFVRRVERLQVGEQGLADFEIEVGGMDYGFEINGILGMDFLQGSGVVINLRDLSLQLSV